MKTVRQEKGPAKPFSNKTFYLDLKDFRQENNLAQDIKILGGKRESFLSKDVSFVVSNRISLKHHLLNSSARKSNSACPSPQLFNDSIFGGICSPLHLTSPGLEQNAAPMSRGLALLQKARLQTKGTGDIMEVCKQWNIKVYHVQKVLSWIEKYKNLYSKYFLAWEKEERRKSIKASENVCKEDGVKKLRPPFIKIEDIKRKYRTRSKQFDSWTEIINPELSRNISELHKQLKVCGNVDIFRPALREIKLNYNTSKSSSKMEGTTAQKNENRAKKTVKEKYCEICRKYFKSLDDHLKENKHKTYMQDSSRFHEVHKIISNLPTLSDFLKLSELHLSPEHSDVPPELPVFRSNEAEFFQPDNASFDMPVLDKISNDSDTDLYSLKEEAYISPSCSSTDCTTLPYLEDTTEKVTAVSVETASPLALNTITRNISDDFPFPGICSETNAALSVINFTAPLPLENAIASTTLTSYNSVVDIDINETLKISDFQETNIKETEGSFRNQITSSYCILDSLTVPNNSFTAINADGVLNKTNSEETEIVENVCLLMDEILSKLDFQEILKENIELDNKVRQTEEQVSANRELNSTEYMFTTSNENNVQLSYSNILIQEHNDKYTHMQSDAEVQCDIKVIETEGCRRQESKSETLLNEKNNERLELYSESPSADVTTCNDQKKRDKQKFFIDTKSQLINVNVDHKEQYSDIPENSIKRFETDADKCVKIESLGMITDVENARPKEKSGASLHEEEEQTQLSTEKERLLIAVRLEEKSLSKSYESNKNFELISTEAGNPLNSTNSDQKKFELRAFRNSLNEQDKSIELNTCTEHSFHNDVDKLIKQPSEQDFCSESSQLKRKSNAIFDGEVSDNTLAKIQKLDVSGPKRCYADENMDISDETSFAEVSKTNNENAINELKKSPVHVLFNTECGNDFALTAYLKNVESFLENVFISYEHEESRKNIELDLLENIHDPMQDSEACTINSITESPLIEGPNGKSVIQVVADKPVSAMLDSNITTFEAFSMLNPAIETLNGVSESILPEKTDQETSATTSRLIISEDSTSHLNNQNFDHSVHDMVCSHDANLYIPETDVFQIENTEAENESLMDLKEITEVEKGKTPVDIGDKQTVNSENENKDSISSILHETHAVSNLKKAPGVEAVNKETGIIPNITVKCAADSTYDSAKHSFDQNSLFGSSRASSLDCIYRKRKLKLSAACKREKIDQNISLKNCTNDVLLHISRNPDSESNGLDLTSHSPTRRQSLCNTSDNFTNSINYDSVSTKNLCSIQVEETFNPENCIECQNACNNSPFVQINNRVLNNSSFICIEQTLPMTENCEHYVFDFSKKSCSSSSSCQSVIVNANSYEDADFSSSSEDDCMWQSLQSKVNNLCKSIKCDDTEHALDLSLHSQLKA